MEILRKKLRLAQEEIDSAKYIATSAVMKVDELSEEMSLLSKDGDKSSLFEITEIDTGYDKHEVLELREM
eukprot:5104900-Ditylum_brightwellii.AAC.1